MINQDIITVAVILGAVWLPVLLLRVPSAMAFLSLLVGYILSSELGFKVSNFKYGQAILLVAPLLFTVFWLRGRVAGSRLMMEIVPSFCVGISALLFLYPIVSQVQNSINVVTKYKILEYKPYLLVASAVFVLVITLLTYPRSHHKEESKHH